MSPQSDSEPTARKKLGAFVRTGWVTLRAFAVALVAGAFVFIVLIGTESTDCFYESVDINVADIKDTVEGCQDLDTFKSVNAHLANERAVAAEDTDDTAAEDMDHTVEELDSVAGRGHLAVWISLFAATAALSGYTFVRAVVEYRKVRPKGGQSVVDLVLTAGLLGVTFWFLSAQPFEFSDYEDMHSPVINSLARLVGVLLIPALMTMVACGRVSGSKSVDSEPVDDETEPVDLDRVATIGGVLRLMVSLAGAVLALAVITTGARSQAIADLPGADPVPSSVVLIWGAVFALALAIIYVPVHQRWSATLGKVVEKEIQDQFGGEIRAEADGGEPAEVSAKWSFVFGPFLRDEVRIRYEALELPGTPGYRPAELSAKKELMAALGAKGPLAVLQGSLSVLAPVIAAAVSAVFAG